MNEHLEMLKNGINPRDSFFREKQTIKDEQTMQLQPAFF